MNAIYAQNKFTIVTMLSKKLITLFGIVCLLAVEMHSRLMVKLSDTKAFVFTKFMAPCPGKYPISHYENLTFHSFRDGAFSFDYDFVIDRNAKTNLLLLKFKRCPNVESLDACSGFPFRATNFCPLMRSETDVWSPILNCAKPKLPCPYTKGVFRGRNCTVDMEKFKFFPLTTGYWYLEAEVLDDKKTSVYCVTCEGNAVRI